MSTDKPGHSDPTAGKAIGRLDRDGVAAQMRARARMRELRDAAQREAIQRRKAAEAGGTA